ncbi:hypothetical protein ACTA71_001422 [Dictyostelium dimigraforme]
MKVLLSLVFLLFSICYGQNVNPYIVSEVYDIGEVCGSTNTTICNKLTFSAGFAIKQGVCAFMKGLSNFPTSYNVSSDGSSIIAYSYYGEDYDCKEGSISTTTFKSGTCNEGCSTSFTSFLFQLSSSTSNIPAPSGSLLTIKSGSQNCANDWQSTWEEVSYLALNTCIVDSSARNSFKLSCPNGGSEGLTTQYFTDTICSSNPKSINFPLEQDNCDGYQMCI